MGLRDLLRPSIPQKPVFVPENQVLSTVSGKSFTLNTYQINKIKLDVQQAAKRVTARIAKRDLLIEQRDAEILKSVTAAQALDLNEKVQRLLQLTSEFARQQAKSRIEEIVTSALSVVFGRDYKFQLSLEIRANRPEVDYWLASEGIITQLKPPDYDRGGGVADVVSLALRLAVTELAEVQGPVFLDESAKHVSAEYSMNVAYFLKEYSLKFARQIILITHNPVLAEIGDSSIGVSYHDGRSFIQNL
jgi:DNA repair ATPase RecN